MEELYTKVTEIFKKNPPPAHDIKHALRVASLAKKIAQAEGYNTQEAEIAGLLHDLGRTRQKESKGHGPAGVPLAKELLDTYTNFSDGAKKRILTAIAVHSSFKTEGKLDQILQDADKLDGLGAIGLSRAYISCHALPDYDPQDITPEPGEYNKPKDIHQQIKFSMTWYSMLYTQTAQKLGQPRHKFMQKYLEQIKKEIEESN